MRLLGAMLIGLFLNEGAIGETLLRITSEQVVLESEVYQIIGSRTGEVTVKNRASGEVLRTFQMQKDVVIRELFLLDGGNILAASQKNNTMFWDLRTNRRIRNFPGRVYGISHNEEEFLTYDEDEKKLLLYSYPSFEQTCELPTDNPDVGIAESAFSPNDKFLAVVLVPGKPESDKYYPGVDPARTGRNYSKLFNSKSCQETQDFSKLNIFQLGNFSTDSQFYYIDGYIPSVKEGKKQYTKETWRVSLTTNELENLSK